MGPADSGFRQDELLAWCQAHRGQYARTLPYARNPEWLVPTLARTRERAFLRGGRTREFAECVYRTLESWSPAQRVVGKAEKPWQQWRPALHCVQSAGLTSLATAVIYEELHCGCPDMGNAMKVHQREQSGECLTCHGFASESDLHKFRPKNPHPAATIVIGETILAMATA
jgi:hypothetical protein